MGAPKTENHVFTCMGTKIAPLMELEDCYIIPQKCQNEESKEEYQYNKGKWIEPIWRYKWQ